MAPPRIEEIHQHSWEGDSVIVYSVGFLTGFCAAFSVFLVLLILKKGSKLLGIVTRRKEGEGDAPPPRDTKEELRSFMKGGPYNVIQPQPHWLFNDNKSSVYDTPTSPPVPVCSRPLVYPSTQINDEDDDDDDKSSFSSASTVIYVNLDDGENKHAGHYNEDRPEEKPLSRRTALYAKPKRCGGPLSPNKEENIYMCMDRCNSSDQHQLPEEKPLKRCTGVYTKHGGGSLPPCSGHTCMALPSHKDEEELPEEKPLLVTTPKHGRPPCPAPKRQQHFPGEFFEPGQEHAHIYECID